MAAPKWAPEQQPRPRGKGQPSLRSGGRPRPVCGGGEEKRSLLLLPDRLSPSRSPASTTPYRLQRERERRGEKASEISNGRTEGGRAIRGQRQFIGQYPAHSGELAPEIGIPGRPGTQRTGLWPRISEGQLRRTVRTRSKKIIPGPLFGVGPPLPCFLVRTGSWAAASPCKGKVVLEVGEMWEGGGNLFLPPPPPSSPFSRNGCFSPRSPATTERGGEKREGERMS